MCALAHVFEAAGIATVGISIVRGQAVKSRPPRMLHCDFPLGRPLGRPNDPVFQTHVLNAAFALLPRTDVPVLVDFDVSITDDADAPLACQLPPRHDPSLPAAVDEAIAMRPAYDRQLGRDGATTNVVRMGGPDRVPDLVATFVRIADGAPWDDAGLDPRKLGAAALDIRAYYEESAIALADHIPAARQAESWFFRTTETGKLLRQVHKIIRDGGGPREAWFRLVPVGQPPPEAS